MTGASLTGLTSRINDVVSCKYPSDAKTSIVADPFQFSSGVSVKIFEDIVGVIFEMFDLAENVILSHSSSVATRLTDAGLSSSIFRSSIFERIGESLTAMILNQNFDSHCHLDHHLQ